MAHLGQHAATLGRHDRLHQIGPCAGERGADDVGKLRCEIAVVVVDMYQVHALGLACAPDQVGQRLDDLADIGYQFFSVGIPNGRASTTVR